VAFPRDQARKALKQAFLDIQDEDFSMTWKGSGSQFQICFANASEDVVNLIGAICGFELRFVPNVINRLIGACTSLGCGCFDPQKGVRTE
jgi:hypothetical protein